MTNIFHLTKVITLCHPLTAKLAARNTDDANIAQRKQQQNVMHV